MSERLKMLSRVASLYVDRQKGLDLLRHLEDSDLSDDTQDRIIDIMQRMGIVRKTDRQGSDASELPPKGEA